MQRILRKLGEKNKLGKNYSYCCALFVLCNMKEVKKQSRRIIRDPLDVHVGKEKKEANILE